MGFTELLERVVQGTPGCVNCTLLGYDGILIDSVDGEASVDGVSAADATIEYSTLMPQMRKACQNLRAGDLDEVSVRSGKFNMVLRPLSDEYLVVAALAPGGLQGKARYLLRLIAPKLQAELA